jgi:sigma-E factor negative regulatory protein RseC
LAKEEGIVVRTGSETTAWVKTVRTDACESCTSKGACNMLGGGREMEAEAVNKIGAKTGDRVVIAFESSSLVKASFLIYLFPVICLIAGAFIGRKISSVYGLSEMFFSAGGAFLCFGLSFLIVRATGGRMAKKDSYMPVIVKIMNQRRDS